ncbi:CLUMA_CG001004, isoform B [Clunio marinus]|uniref:Annexin n=1 Tax=Clunio marinus TaxID=568069 RepID=A0A1J1HGR1_9DIPT|nr:CLUMA_CG001004, isoform B [Clunio marinus]
MTLPRQVQLMIEPTKSHDNFLGRPSLVRVEKIDVSSDIQILHNALKFITSKRKIVDVLCSRTNRQRIEIIKAYKACYDRDLVEEFQRKFSGDFRDLLIAMLTPTYEFYCRELFDALNGTTVNEDTVIQILVSLSSREIYNVIQKYVKLYGNPLEKDLKTETSGNFKKLLVALANGTRDESNVLDLYSARVDAMELKRAGTEKWGTDASVFNRILCLRNFDQVRLISQEYEFVTGHPLDKDIKKEFSGDILDGILAIIRISENRAEYFARCLYKSMIGIGTDDRGLIRLIITRCELDMEDIKGEFQRKYGKTLKSMIKKDTSGYYRKALLKLIAE